MQPTFSPKTPTLTGLRQRRSGRSISRKLDHTLSRLWLYRSDGSWHQFSGDQLGSLFAARALYKYKRSGKPLGELGAALAPRTHVCVAGQMAMVASTVSSKMIEAMAQKEGFKFVECLTGLKRGIIGDARRLIGFVLRLQVYWECCVSPRSRQV